MEGPLRIVGMRCRTAERSGGLGRGAEALAVEIGERVGVTPRLVGSVEDPVEQGWEHDLEASYGCLLEAGGQVDDALEEGAFPVLTAGDCSIALTTLPTVASHRPDAKILWLDAHGDFNTPESSESGHLGGMALAGACGLWSTGFRGRVPAERVVLCGVRALDPGERTLLDRSEATVIGPSLETLVYLQNALDGVPTYVHLDVDVLDAGQMPQAFPVEGGLTGERLLDLLDAVGDACPIVGLEVTGLVVPLVARAIAEFVEPLLPKELHGLG